MSWDNQTKNDTSFAEETKNESVFDNLSKSASSFSGQTKTSSSFDDGVAFLLTEFLSFLLLESGKKIVLDQSDNYVNKSIYTNQIKN